MNVNKAFLKLYSAQKISSSLILQGVLFTWFIHSETRNLDYVCRLELVGLVYCGLL